MIQQPLLAAEARATEQVQALKQDLKRIPAESASSAKASRLRLELAEQERRLTSLSDEVGTRAAGHLVHRAAKHLKAPLSPRLHALVEQLGERDLEIERLRAALSQCSQHRALAEQAALECGLQREQMQKLLDLASDKPARKLPKDRAAERKDAMTKLKNLALNFAGPAHAAAP